jgi:hypothetical protein
MASSTRGAGGTAKRLLEPWEKVLAIFDMVLIGTLVMGGGYVGVY